MEIRRLDIRGIRWLMMLRSNIFHNIIDIMLELCIICLGRGFDARVAVKEAAELGRHYPL